jgi:hypothetical protein
MIAETDRSLRSRLSMQLISPDADSEPRPQGATYTSFSAAGACGAGWQPAADWQSALGN